jgi:hypothetical protein
MNHQPMVDCAACEAALDCYDRLGVVERAAVDQHLDACAVCGGALQPAAELGELFAALDVAPPASFADDVVHAAVADTTPSDMPRAEQSLLPALLALLSLQVVALLALRLAAFGQLVQAVNATADWLRQAVADLAVGVGGAVHAGLMLDALPMRLDWAPWSAVVLGLAAVGFCLIAAPPEHAAAEARCR